MPKDQFAHVETWIFDLDNTLYPPEARLFDQIEVRMTDWVAKTLNLPMDRANAVRHDYWQRYGTTLAGLMREHDVDPAPYLHHVHDISLDHLSVDEALTTAIARLPGRCIVYTNGSEPYARRVLAARGLDGLFEAVYGVEHANFHPKPERQAFDAIVALDGLTPSRAAMFEDDARNLAEPHAMGMRCVHVAAEPAVHDHVHHHTDNLAAFLARLI